MNDFNEYDKDQMQTMTNKLTTFNPMALSGTMWPILYSKYNKFWAWRNIQ